MIVTSHRIRRQRWDVRVATATGALDARRQLRSAWSDVLAPVFERAFDAVAPEGARRHIARLEVRVRVTDASRLAENVAAEVERQLLELLPRALDADLWTPGRPQVAQHAAADMSDFATLLHYVRTGALPWHAAGAVGDAVVASLRAAIHAERERLALALKAEGRDADAIFRALQLLGSDDRPAFVATLVGAAPEPWPSVLDRLLASDDSPPGGSASEHARLSVVSAVCAALMYAAPREVLADVLASTAHLETRDRTALHDLLASLVWGASASPLAGSVVPGVTHDHPAPRTPHPTPLTAPPAPRTAPHAPRPEYRTPHPDHDPADFGLPVTSAGLVLLHPFIPTLFEHLGVAANGVISEGSLPRAAALLHFVATGGHEIHEFDLGLIKPLLGLSDDASLPVAEGLVSVTDADEIEAMLQSVIAHWSALRSSSVAALRATFLQRRGLLSPADPGWRLRVESAPFDVLLDHLPWSVSVCKLPWMPHPVYTEWSTS